VDAIARQPLARLSAPPGAFPVGALLLGLGVVAGAAAAMLGLDRLPVAICYFKALSGLPCLSCGGTRAVAELARLDPAGALAMNPLATLAGLALIPWGLGDLLLWLRGRALRLSVAPALRPALRWGLMAALVLNWAYLIAAGR
jgi:hypothetical protein